MMLAAQVNMKSSTTRKLDDIDVTQVRAQMLRRWPRAPLEQPECQHCCRWRLQSNSCWIPATQGAVIPRCLQECLMHVTAANLLSLPSLAPPADQKPARSAVAAFPCRPQGFQESGSDHVTPMTPRATLNTQQSWRWTSRSQSNMPGSLPQSIVLTLLLAKPSSSTF